MSRITIIWQLSFLTSTINLKGQKLMSKFFEYFIKTWLFFGWSERWIENAKIMLARSILNFPKWPVRERDLPEVGKGSQKDQVSCWIIGFNLFQFVWFHFTIWMIAFWDIKFFNTKLQDFIHPKQIPNLLKLSSH